MRPSYVFLFLLMCLSIAARLGSSDERTEHLSSVVEYVLTKGIPDHKISPNPRHPLIKKPEERTELAEAVRVAASEYRISEFDLLTIAFREGSFRNGSIGKLGERSTFQIMPRLAKMANRAEERCSLDTYQGAAFCVAVLWSHALKQCKGNQKGAYIFYATGRTCKPDSPRLDWLSKDRAGISAYLSQLNF